MSETNPVDWWNSMDEDEQDEVFPWVIEGTHGTGKDFIQSLWSQYRAGRSLSEKQIVALKKYHDNKGRGKFA